MTAIILKMLLLERSTGYMYSSLSGHFKMLLLERSTGHIYPSLSGHFKVLLLERSTEHIYPSLSGHFKMLLLERSKGHIYPSLSGHFKMPPAILVIMIIPLFFLLVLSVKSIQVNWWWLYPCFILYPSFLARISGECLTIHSLPALFFFLNGD